MALLRPAASSRMTPYRFQDLPALTHHEVVLWNWYCRVGPGEMEWTAWVDDIFGHLLERPAGLEMRLVQMLLVDAQAGEKMLAFGSKQELLIGRGPDNDIVLAANSISTRHARLALQQDGRAYLEDLSSRLGTYLWDRRLNPNQLQPLMNGDQFTVFPYRFRVLLERRWIRESGVKLSECSVAPMSREEFARTSPVGWRAFTVDAHPSGERALLQVNPDFLTCLQQQMLAPLGFEMARDAVPSDDGLFAFLVLALLERLNQRLKFPVQLSLSRGTRDGLPDATRGMLLSFAVQAGGLAGRFRVFLPFEFIARCRPEDDAAVAATYPPGLCWNLPISAGHVDLSPEEIAQVSPGDILVAQRGAAALFPNDFGKGWTLVPDASNVTAFKVDKYFERSASLESGGEVQQESERPDIQALPLRLLVVLGQKEFTLAEIQSLSSGTVVELNVAKSDPVRLMVNGRILGEGELVDVDGSLAVKVLRWRSG